MPGVAAASRWANGSANRFQGDESPRILTTGLMTAAGLSTLHQRSIP